MGRNSGKLALVAIACALVSSQCGDNTLAPFQPEVTSATDNFQLQATGVRNRTATLNYPWQNTGNRATVNHSTTTTSGSARLVILDADGVSVYDHALVPSLTDSTGAGPAGAWTIRLVLDHYSGTLNFRVQKR
jgi:hypothetical protein